MPDVFDENGTRIGTIALSQRQLQLLEDGQTVTVQYHTPLMLRHLLGTRAGAFDLRGTADHIVVRQVEALRTFIDLQAGIKQARETNAKSAGPTR